MRDMYIFICAILASILSVIANEALANLLPTTVTLGIYIYKIITAGFIALVFVLLFMMVDDRIGGEFTK